MFNDDFFAEVFLYESFTILNPDILLKLSVTDYGVFWDNLIARTLTTNMILKIHIFSSICNWLPKLSSAYCKKTEAFI